MCWVLAVLAGQAHGHAHLHLGASQPSPLHRRTPATWAGRPCQDVQMALCPAAVCAPRAPWAPFLFASSSPVGCGHSSWQLQLVTPCHTVFGIQTFIIALGGYSLY